jgi:hypothetical protein
MKSLIAAAFAVSILAAPAVTFAQDANAPVTRAQVRAELAQLEAAGYRPGVSSPNYPADIQAAQARVAAQQSAYGASTNGSSQSGSRAAVATPVQSGQVTHAQLRAELAQLEKVGYRPGVSSPNYPADLRAAQARVAQQDAAAYGASTDGSSQAGVRSAQ